MPFYKRAVGDRKILCSFLDSTHVINYLSAKSCQYGNLISCGNCGWYVDVIP